MATNQDHVTSSAATSSSSCITITTAGPIRHPSQAITRTVAAHNEDDIGRSNAVEVGNTIPHPHHQQQRTY